MWCKIVLRSRSIHATNHKNLIMNYYSRQYWSIACTVQWSVKNQEQCTVIKLPQQDRWLPTATHTPGHVINIWGNICWKRLFHTQLVITNTSVRDNCLPHLFVNYYRVRIQPSGFVCKLLWYTHSSMVVMCRLYIKRQLSAMCMPTFQASYQASHGIQPQELSRKELE